MPARTISSTALESARGTLPQPSTASRELGAAQTPGTMVLSLLGLALTACTGSGELDLQGFDDAAIVADYTDHIVVSNYESLASRLETLHQAILELQADPTDARAEAARTAWISARAPWELSEAYLFGPVDAYGFDPSLDDWPVNQVDLDAILAGSDPLTAEYVSALDTALKGFHGVEYLLFGEAFDGTSGATAASALSSRDLDYLVLTSGELAQVAGQLRDAWTVGIDGQPPYAETFKSAGADDNRIYPSLQAAGEEMLRGMIAICDEVANGKLADPYDQQNINLIESQFSLNSTEDFKNNLKGVQEVYLGQNSLTGEAGLGLTDFVSPLDSSLDARLKQEMQAAIDALAAIPYPFRDAVLNPDDADTIEAAQNAIRTVQQSLERDVLPLVTGANPS